MGRFGPHQRFLVAQQLGHLDFLDAAIARLSAEVAERLRPCAAELARLDEIPGVGRATAEVIVAELGTNKGRFPTDRHAASAAETPRTAPTGLEHVPYLCWQLRLLPRPAVPAGLELATGIPVITTTPEHAAKRLRSAVTA